MIAGSAFSSRRYWPECLAAASLIVALDAAVKQTVMWLMPYGASVSITPFFNVVHVWNTGAAFSFLADAGGWQRYAFSILGIGVSIVLAWLLWRGVSSRLEAAAYTLIVGGALGNVVDRIARGHVVDYLDLHWRGWHWPAFNLADIAITLGASFLILASFRRPVLGTASDPQQAGNLPYAQQLTSLGTGNLIAANFKTALILAFIAATFFAAVVVRHWIW